jgi:hypothetical protein
MGSTTHTYILHIIPHSSVLQLFFTCSTPLFVRDTWQHTTRISRHGKGDMKLYIYKTVNMYLHINPCHVSKQAYERKTQHMLNKTNSDEAMCVCVLLWILTTNGKILLFSNYNLQIHNFLWKFDAYLKPCGGIPVAEHWHTALFKGYLETLTNFNCDLILMALALGLSFKVIS